MLQPVRTQVAEEEGRPLASSVSTTKEHTATKGPWDVPQGGSLSLRPPAGGGGRGTKNTRVKKNGMSPAQALQNK